MRITCETVNISLSKAGPLLPMELFPSSSKLRNVCKSVFFFFVISSHSLIFSCCPENLDSVILLGHIPLARSESARCGPLREQGTIRRGAGPGWQSTLSKQSTNFLLDTLRPSIIFSCVIFFDRFPFVLIKY